MLEVAGAQSNLSVREKWRERIKAYIEEHLRDPGLSLGQIAAVMNCSKRYVHKIFESDGTTTAGYIWRMRLCPGREQLPDPAFANNPITQIAYSCRSSGSDHSSSPSNDVV